MHRAWPGYYISLRLTCIQFHSPNVTPLTNTVKITIRGFCNSHSLTRGWRNSNHIGVVSITVKLLIQHGGKLRGVRAEQLPAQNNAMGHFWHNDTSLLSQPSTTSYCDRFEKKMRQNGQQRTFQAHRVELKDNPPADGRPCQMRDWSVSEQF